MKNTISNIDIESLKIARSIALKDIKQKEKKISAQLSEKSCLFDTLNLVQNEKNINFTTAADIKQTSECYMYQEYIF